MKEGETYVPGAFAGGVKNVNGEDAVPCSGNINGMVSRMIPYDLLDLRLVFEECEPGKIKPKWFTEQVVEPISYDPVKHPIPQLFWWHKNIPMQRPLSYATKPEEIVTEGEDHNVWKEYSNPGAYLNRRLSFKKSAYKFWGHATQNQREKSRKFAGERRPHAWKHNKLRKFQGANPYWVQSMLSNEQVHGADYWRKSTQPHYSYWKFIPMLGYTGWGTKEGHVVVEELYTKVGLDQIQWWIDTGMLNTNEVITPNTLVESRCVGDYHWPGIKITFNNCKWFKGKIDIDVESVDPKAIEAIEANGGSVTTRWRDHEAIAKEKTPWRFPVIGEGNLPPEELIRDVYANEKMRGYMTESLAERMRAHPDSPREWTNLEKPPSEINEIPPIKERQVSEPEYRSPIETSLLKKQEYWDDFLSNTANTSEARMGLITPDKFGIWEYTYYHKNGPGHEGKREPPAGEEVTLFPGYPLRDSRYFKFIDGEKVCLFFCLLFLLYCRVRPSRNEE